MIEIFIGFISGIVSGTGMGGGTILIVLLTSMLGIEQRVAQASNLVFFIPTSIMAIIINFKQKNIDVKIALTITFSGIIGAILGATIAMNIDVIILKRCFGIFLLFIAFHEIYELIFKNRQ